MPKLCHWITADCTERSNLGIEPGVARRLISIDVEPAGYVRQQFGQVHDVPGTATAARLLEGVCTPFVSL